VTKRDFLKALVATSALATPVAAISAGIERLVVYDGRHAAARRFGLGIAARFDCAHDAAQLWQREIAPRLAAGSAIAGMTCAADLMIVADLARYRRLRLRSRQPQRGGLITWLIA
jgi:hypothetical protein